MLLSSPPSTDRAVGWTRIDRFFIIIFLDVVLRGRNLGPTVKREATEDKEERNGATNYCFRLTTLTGWPN